GRDSAPSRRRRRDRDQRSRRRLLPLPGIRARPLPGRVARHPLIGRLRLAMLAAALPALAGCGTRGEPHVFSVSIVNDTAGPVVVRDCNDYCSSSPIELHLAPGAGAPINRVATQHKSFSITSSSGDHIGCLDLYYTAPQPGARALVSTAAPCSG